MELPRLDLAQVVEDQDLQRLLVAGELPSLRQQQVIVQRGRQCDLALYPSRGGESS